MYKIMLKILFFNLLRILRCFGTKLYRKVTALQVIFIFVVVPHCFLIIYHYYPREKMGYEQINLIIEDQLKRSLTKKNGSGCVMPYLEVFSHDAVNTLDLDKRPGIVCPEQSDWVECFNSECYVILFKNIVVCEYSDIIHVHDDYYYVDDHVEVVRGPHSYKLNRSDHVAVSCTAWEKTYFGLPKRTFWKGVKTGFRPVEVPQKPFGRTNEYNVMIIVLDSTSQYDFIRYMPRSYTYLTEIMGAVILKSYSSVGPSTAANMFPVLTGKAATELPDTRKSMATDKFINEKDFIFYQAKQFGYRTAYFDEYPGTFDKYHNGFRNQPADHYLPSFLRAAELENPRKVRRLKYKCVGGKPLFQKLLSLTKEFQDLDGAKLSVTHIKDIAGNVKNYLHNAENSLIELLGSIRVLAADTVVIVMGDHGVRDGPFYKTPQGQIEERLPLMAIVLPDQMKKNRPNAYKALRKNSDVLTTHFDLHATLMDVLELPYTNKYMVPGSVLPRSISLLREIPKSRTCAQAGIIPEICGCTAWYYVSGSDHHYKQVVSILSDLITDIVSDVEAICATRSVVSVQWVRRLGNIYFQMDKDLKQYFEDPIFIRPKILHYQAKIVMSPNNAIYLGKVIYDVEQNYFKTSEDNVERINSYTDESDCIARSHPELQPFCFCKNHTIWTGYFETTRIYSKSKKIKKTSTEPKL